MEPLHTTENLERRDDNRWELDPASAEEEDRGATIEHAESASVVGV
jgi:hypothetical protein